MALDYREDIDGLRAFAVLSVLFFHLGLKRLAGGFVGVDVFFVISGYLITGFIKRDIEGSRFSFYSFYARRLRRLMPAMLATIAACWIVAFLIFEPSLMKSFAQSALASLAAISNILFWHESGYFDLGARLKPLLHTWSLSVEWQFYAVWPAFIVCASAVRRRWFAPALIAAVTTISLAAVIAVDLIPFPWISDSQSAVFYMMPFRIFEFGIGALLVWLPAAFNLRVGNKILEAALVSGMILIGFSVFQYSTHTLLPTLVPSIGAALAIVGGPARFSGLVLRNRAAVFLGKISYSIYLVHWPLIVFTEYYLFKPLNDTRVAILFAASIGLATVLHYLVERPFHQRDRIKMTAHGAPALLVLAIAAVAVPSLLGAHDGMAWRIDENAFGIREETVKTMVDKRIMGGSGCEGACVISAAENPYVLVVGDSHVDHYSKTLDAMAGGRYKFLMAYGPSCYFGADMMSANPSPSLQKTCIESNATLKNWVDEQHLPFVAIIVSQFWPAYHENLISKADGTPIHFGDQADQYDHMLADIGKRYKGFKGKVVIIGGSPTTNLSCYLRPRYLPVICPHSSQEDFNEFRRSFERFASSTPLDISLVSPADTICGSDGACRVVDGDGHILYTDAHHLSVYGARLIVPQILSLIDRRKAATVP